jgi:hypothetical protein
MQVLGLTSHMQRPNLGGFLLGSSTADRTRRKACSFPWLGSRTALPLQCHLGLTGIEHAGKLIQG